MLKLNSHALLLLTLVFSTAHAPTFPFWLASSAAKQPAQQMFEAPRTAFAHPDLAGAWRELSEDDGLHRFQIDELNLPNLDVSLPELFEWSALDRTYFASLGPSINTHGFVYLATNGTHDPARLFGDYPFAGAGINGLGPSIGGFAGPHGTSGPAGAPNYDVQPTEDLSDLLTPVQSDPDSVPEPGTLALLALGFAGLHMAGRKKKKRLAAS